MFKALVSGKLIGDGALEPGKGLLATIRLASAIALCRFCCFLKESLLLQ